DGLLGRWSRRRPGRDQHAPAAGLRRPEYAGLALRRGPHGHRHRRDGVTYDLSEPEVLEIVVDDGEVDGPPTVEPAAIARGGAVAVWAALGAVWATLAVTGWARW